MQDTTTTIRERHFAHPLRYRMILALLRTPSCLWGLIPLGLSWIVASQALLTTLRTAHLTFEWDEWTVLAGMASGPSWLLQEHIGHFFPLGRAVYWAETRLFGLDYGGYVLVNYALLLATSTILWRVFTRLVGSSLLAGCLAAMWVLAHGQYYNVIWALQIAWFLAMFFTAILLSRVTMIERPLAGPANITLMLLIWLSFGSTILAVPGFVLAGRALARWRQGALIARSDLAAFAFVFVLSFGLLAMGRTIIGVFPPPHIGARMPPVSISERTAKLPTILADSLAGYGFFATAPLIPGALHTYRQRGTWGEWALWLAERRARVGGALVATLAVSAMVCWRVFRRPQVATTIDVWLASATVLLWFPITITTIARSGIYGPPLTPRYDTWLVLASLIATTAILASRVGESYGAQDAQRRWSRRAQMRILMVLRTAATMAIVVHVLWLAWNFKASLAQVAAARDATARGWGPLLDRCRTQELRTALIIPKELQPELTTNQYCWIVDYMGRDKLTTLSVR